MHNRTVSRILAVLGAIGVVPATNLAIEVQDYAVLVTAAVSSVPPAITLSWPLDSNAVDYVVSRRAPGEVSWVAGPALPGSTTRYVDRRVAVGLAYEYRIVKNGRESSQAYIGYGLIQAGINVRLVNHRGKLILLVDETVAPGLQFELARLVEDLVGDGWTVSRHDVSRSAPVADIKAIIKAEYDADPTQVEAVFLFGHVPVPYSGYLYPDGHSSHMGAWPADAFYGDMDGTYTDETVHTTTAARPENHNVPGDGKYDNSLIPDVGGQARVELQVGRVDLADLPAFEESEEALLRRYLDKNHAYRHNLTPVERHGLIDDRFGTLNGAAFAADGWRNFAPLLGSQNTFTGNLLTTLQSGTWLWAYGCGPGDYTAIPSLVSTSDFATNNLQAVFVLLLGSYFGEWNTQDNLLRAPLAGAGSSLASAWAGIPNWYFYPMGLGQTIGNSARLTQNENLLGQKNIGVNQMHVALMGDPTLRMHPMCPPRNLSARKGLSNTYLLRWNAALEPVAGYRVYAAAAPGGPFYRLTKLPLKGTRLAVRNRPSGRTYMVRAVKLQSTPSGSYFNQSQGAALTLPH